MPKNVTLKAKAMKVLDRTERKNRPKRDAKMAEKGKGMTERPMIE